MIAYFPAPYPDELAYSWFCRYYVHSGFLSHKTALQELYCKRSDNPSKEFIGNLNPDAKEQIFQLISPEKLVMQHTMYPQYARFIPLDQKKIALYRLAQDVCDAHHLFCILPRNEGEQYLRFCPLCTKEDREQYGETYWHRKHQIRNMSVCVKHRCRLVESCVSVKSEQSLTFCPAEAHIQKCQEVLVNDGPSILFATYLESVFDSPMALEKDIPISSVLYDGMSRTMYLKPSGRSRYTQRLADDLKRFYNGMDTNNVSSLYQIQRVVLGSRFDFSVVCQIAFFLGIEVNELTVPSLTADQIQKEQHSHYMKATIPVDWERLDVETVPKLEELVRPIYDGTANELGRPERVSERLVYREMDLLGHQLENMPRCKAVFERYTESYPENWARRIIWAYHRLEENGSPFYWSDIRKLSGVKKKNFQSTIPYFKKYTDADTATKIVELVRLNPSL